MQSKNYSRLFDIPSLPDELLKQKFTTTQDDFYDPNTVENFMKENIRYNGTEKPLFEHELPRTENPYRTTLMSVFDGGSKYSHDPYHPEIFLGDMSRDPRGVGTDPNVSQMMNQARYRQEKYIVGKLQDDPDHRVEGVMPGKLVHKLITQGFANTATRMGSIFDDSTDGAVRRSNPNPGRTIVNVGDNLTQDQKYGLSSSEYIMPSMGYNPISKLSNNIGIHWKVQPEGKFGVSSVSNLYRSKNEVDQAANAVFRMGKQDGKFGTEQQTLTQSVMIPTKQVQDAAVVALTADSQKNSFLNRISHPSINPGGKAMKTTQLMQKQGFEQQTHKGKYLRPYNGNKQLETIAKYEPFKGIVDINSAHNATPVPKKDKLKIMKHIKRDGKVDTIGNERFSKRYTKNSKALSKAFTKKIEQYNEKQGANVHKTPSENVLYKQAKMHKPEDRASTIKLTATKFNSAKELLVANPTGQTNTIKTTSMNDFDYDTLPTMDNAAMTQRVGAQAKSFQSYKKHIYDNDISPVSEVINTRRYLSRNDEAERKKVIN